MKRAPLLVGCLLVAGAVLMPLTGGLGPGRSDAGIGSSPPTDAGGAAGPRSSDPRSGDIASGRSPAAPTSARSVVPSRPSASPAAQSVGDVLIVPVTQFRTTRTATDAAEVAEILAGRSKRFEALELVEDEADAILDALDLSRPTDQTRLILAADAAALTADLARHRTRLAFLRADAITPAVRALDWADASLFGVDRVRTSVGWTLAATLPLASSNTSFDPTATWTLVAGGDIMLDRGVAQTLKVRGRGADFPFDGGRAEITGHICCSAFGWEIPQTRRTGGQGQMRRLIEGADLAIANFENPAPEAFRYHTSGTVFSADPELIEGLATAGFDWVGLANNHIRDAGGNGIIDTIKNLDRYGIASSGAGDNLGAARTPAILDAAGTKVALLAYDTIRRSYTAGPETPGSARLTAKAVRADIRKARRAGADVIIVFPHWGVEYDKRPFDGQRRLAQAAVDAGADLVIGNHAHWAGAMEVYEGKPVWYALGNFVFDQTWSEPTMEGLTLELTFHGADLVQARMRPHIILDKAQPNFLDPAADGRVVMNQVWTGSDALDLLPW